MHVAFLNRRAGKRSGSGGGLWKYDQSDRYWIFHKAHCAFVQNQTTIQTNAFKVTYSSQIQHSHFLWEEEESVILKHSSWTHIHSEHMTEVSLVFLQRQWGAQAESTTCEAVCVTRFPGLSFLLYKMEIAARLLCEAHARSSRAQQTLQISR